MQDKHSNRSSQVEDEYEQELSCLRSRLASQQYQLNDMKEFIKNQKAIYAKELEQLKLTYEQSMQHTTTKYEAEVNALSLQLENARQERSSVNGNHLAIEVSCLLQNELESRMGGLAAVVQSKMTTLCEKFTRCDKLIRKRLATLLNLHYEKSLQVLSINKELEDRTKLLERQKRFLERIVQEKHESDQMYEKQLIFLEEVNQQRREMCHHLEKVNSQLQNENGLLRQQLSCSNGGRRKTEASVQPNSVYINLEQEDQFKRPTRIVQISHPTQRRGQNKSCLRDQKQSTANGSNKTSPLRSRKAHESIRTQNSPCQRLQRQQSLALGAARPSATNFNKRAIGKTIDVYTQNYKHSKGKENLERAYG